MKQDASCTLCFKVVLLTNAGQLRRHKNRIGVICRGNPFNPQPVKPDRVQLDLDVATVAKGGAA